MAYDGRKHEREGEPSSEASVAKEADIGGIRDHYRGLS